MLGSPQMVLLLMLRQCVKEIQVALYFVTSTEKSHFLVFYQEKNLTKRAVGWRAIPGFSMIFIIFPSGFNKVYLLDPDGEIKNSAKKHGKSRISNFCYI